MPGPMDWLFRFTLLVMATLYEYAYFWPRFRAGVAAGRADARPTAYRRGIIGQWLFAGTALVIWWANARPWPALRLAVPHGWRPAVAIGVVLAAIGLLVPQLWTGPRPPVVHRTAGPAALGGGATAGRASHRRAAEDGQPRVHAAPHAPGRTLVRRIISDGRLLRRAAVPRLPALGVCPLARFRRRPGGRRRRLRRESFLSGTHRRDPRYHRRLRDGGNRMDQRLAHSRDDRARADRHRRRHDWILVTARAEGRERAAAGMIAFPS